MRDPRFEWKSASVWEHLCLVSVCRFATLADATRVVVARQPQGNANTGAVIAL